MRRRAADRTPLRACAHIGAITSLSAAPPPSLPLPTYLAQPAAASSGAAFYSHSFAWPLPPAPYLAKAPHRSYIVRSPCRPNYLQSLPSARMRFIMARHSGGRMAAPPRLHAVVALAPLSCPAMVKRCPASQHLRRINQLATALPRLCNNNASAHAYLALPSRLYAPLPLLFRLPH